MTYFHPTVLKKEAIDYLVHEPHGLYIDATCGGGGHTEEMLLRFPQIRVIACDWDLKALEAARRRLQGNTRVEFEHVSFSHLYRLARKRGLKEVSGIIADFGTSRPQIEDAPGFSFTHDTPLDMRMSVGHKKATAADLLARLSEKELREIFYTYGEERFSHKIASAIVEERATRRIKSTLQLASLIERVVPRHGKIHPATRVFQALRIAVNGELDEIQALLEQGFGLLAPGGRMVCISFHSLEDRAVKKFMRHRKTMIQDVGGLILPSSEEIDQNPASRSAKMRVLEKKLE